MNNFGPYLANVIFNFMILSWPRRGKTEFWNIRT